MITYTSFSTLTRNGVHHIYFQKYYTLPFLGGVTPILEGEFILHIKNP